jgi:hypothetical protein
MIASLSPPFQIFGRKDYQRIKNFNFRAAPAEDYQKIAKIAFASQPCDLLITHGTLLTLHRAPSLLYS